MLFPFLPRKPHLFARPPSSSGSINDGWALLLLVLLKSSPGVAGREPCLTGFDGLELPPRIAETEECAQRACLRMAEVTVIHSVVIKVTGSTATEIGATSGLLFEPFRCGVSEPSRSFCPIVEVSLPSIADSGTPSIPSELLELLGTAALLIARV
jgi:hypothetical protein